MSPIFFNTKINTSNVPYSLTQEREKKTLLSNTLRAERVLNIYQKKFSPVTTIRTLTYKLKKEHKFFKKLNGICSPGLKKLHTSCYSVATRSSVQVPFFNQKQKK